MPDLTPFAEVWEREPGLMPSNSGRVNGVFVLGYRATLNHGRPLSEPHLAEEAEAECLLQRWLEQEGYIVLPKIRCATEWKVLCLADDETVAEGPTKHAAMIAAFGEVWDG